MSRKVHEVITVAAVLTRMFPGLIIDKIVGLKRSHYFEVRASHDMIPDQLNGRVKLEAVIAEVKRTCPDLIAAKPIAGHACPVRPKVGGIQFKFPLPV
jgi:hypothetical protein